MSIPEAVQRQNERADQLIAQIAQRQNAQKPVAQHPAPAPAQTQATPQEAPVTPPAAPAAPPAQPASVDQAQWENRYKVMAGKYNAEVPRMAAQLKDLAAQNAALQEQVKELAQRPVQKSITDADIETIGQGSYEVIQKAIADAVGEKDRVIKELSGRLQRLEGTTEKHAVSSFMSTLSAEVPDWAELNVDPEFLRYLDEVDPATGQTRQKLLEDAQAQNDGRRAAYFFKSYKQITQTQKQAAAQVLSGQVMPGGSGGGTPPPPNPQNKRIWTGKEVKEFYDNLRTGKYRANPKEAMDIEAEINLAISERRVR